MRMREIGEQGSAAAFSGKLLDLPFDRYQRCRIVADALERLRGDDRPVRILDADSDGEISNFLPGYDVVAKNPAENGDTGVLPFGDEPFDYVVSVDTLAHVSPEARLEYLSELRRSARRGVLLAAPFGSEAVRGAEKVVNEFHHSVYPSESLPLREHSERGLPDLDVTRGFFEDQGDEVTVLPNGYLPHWLAMTCLSIYGAGLDGGSGGALDRAQAFYNEFVYELDNAEPCYRRLLVALRRPTNADLEGLASPPQNPERAAQSSAFFGVLSTVLPLTSEMKRLGDRLARYERKLSETEGALARKEAQADDLSDRIAGMIGLYEENAKLVEQNAILQDQLIKITSSRIWVLLAGPRALRRWLLQLRGPSG